MATWTEADVTALKAAVASGVLTVTYGGGGTPSRTVTYQSLDSMRRLLAEMTASVAADAGTRTTYRLASTRKGV